MLKSTISNDEDDADEIILECFGLLRLTNAATKRTGVQIDDPTGAVIKII